MKSDVTKQIKEKRGKEVCNAQGNPKRPWLSTLFYFVLTYFSYCSTVYLAILWGNSLLRKRGLILMSEGDLGFTKSVLAKILRSHAYVPSKRELRDQSDS